MLHKIEKRVCPYSKLEFIPKRNNQLFANKEYRIAFHNEIQNSFRWRLSAINKEIISSYKTLIEILEEKKSMVVHYQFLKGKNFSFKVFTGVSKTDKGIAYELYDTSFLRIDENNYLITKL
jgi:hypothetical protein